MPRRYSGAQLVAGKILAGLILTLVLGYASRSPKLSFPLAVLGAAVVLAAALLVYEGVGWVTASGLGRLWPPPVPALDTMLPLADGAAPSPPGQLRLRDGLACLALFLVAQAVVWLVVILLAYARVGAGATEAARSAEILGAAPAALPLSMALSSLVLVVMLKSLARRLSWEPLRSDVGLAWGSVRSSAVGFGGGLALAIAYLVTASLVAKYSPPHPGFMSQMASGSAPGRWSWIVVAVLMAGPAEEVLFRGVLLSALSKTVRVSIAGLASAFAFWLLHLPEVAGFWPAAVFIGLFAIFATVLRVRTRTLGPSIAAHVAYNLVLGVLVAV